MIANLTPADIEAKALDARVTLTEVLEKAGVARNTFYRWRRGEGNMLPLTKARLLDAIEALDKK